MRPQTVGHYTVLMADHCPPQDAAYRKHAVLVEETGRIDSGVRENFLYKEEAIRSAFLRLDI